MSGSVTMLSIIPVPWLTRKKRPIGRGHVVADFGQALKPSPLPENALAEHELASAAANAVQSLMRTNSPARRAIVIQLENYC